MGEVFHERLKSPIPTRELERRSQELLKVMKRENLDCILAQNITLYMGGANRWLTDTTAEIHYPQSSFLTKDGDIGYIACSGPPLDLYPPSHLLRIGQPWDAAPYFSVFNFTWDWEGKLFERWIKENNPKRIGIAGMEMFHWNYYDYLEKNFPYVEFIDVSSLIDEIKAVKSEDEINFLEKSAFVLDKVMNYLPAVAQPGVREYEVRSKAMQLASDLGGEEAIVIIGSAPRDEKFDLMPSFFQNRELQKGDQMYVKLQCSGPGGMYTTLGRMFSIGTEPSASMQQSLQEAIAAQDKLVSMLKVGMDPQVIFAQYNEYLVAQGYKQETGLFAYGQGYDHIERPSIQPGETLPLAKDMCMAVNTNLVSATRTFYLADSFLLKPNGPQRMSKTPLAILRT
ncbi:MAG TPA: aminopeptidase P family protein [Peptococcaceae bacterium]|nr:aminopeptidase P family protein [Peptococcaceae bacterium]